MQTYIYNNTGDFKPVKSSKMDNDKYSCNAIAITAALEASGFTIAMNEDGQGEANYLGFVVPFTIGNENFYFFNNTIYSKCMINEAITALLIFINDMKDLS